MRRPRTCWPRAAGPPLRRTTWARPRCSSMRCWSACPARGTAMPDLTFTRLGGSPDSTRLLVVGPSLGTSVEALWDRAAALLDAEVVGWDLPGHGRSAPATAPFSVADLADGVRGRTEELAAGRPASYAGVSLGGAVALQLAVEPGVLDHVVCIASGAKVGEPSMWAER